MQSLSDFQNKLKAAESAGSTLPWIYLFGDSLTELAFKETDNGWGYRVQEYFKGKAWVKNCGRSGFTTTRLVDYFQKEVIEDGVKQSKQNKDPLFVTVFLGANDACFQFPGWNTIVALPEYILHLRHYVTSILRVFHDTKVVLITPPPINVTLPTRNTVSDEDYLDAARAGRGHLTWLSKRQFAEACAELGREFEAETERVALLDLWTKIEEDACGGPEAFAELDTEDKLPGCGLPGAKSFQSDSFTDGLHFASKNQEILGQKFLELITTKWPEFKHGQEVGKA